VVPAGFTRVVYDRVPDASDPNGSRLDGPKPDQIPVAMEFLGRPFDEALLFEIASAYEAGTAEGIWPARRRALAEGDQHHQRYDSLCEGFRMTAPSRHLHLRWGPSSESLQGRNPQEVEVRRCRALWRFDRGVAGVQKPLRGGMMLLWVPDRVIGFE